MMIFVFGVFPLGWAGKPKIVLDKHGFDINLCTCLGEHEGPGAGCKVPRLLRAVSAIVSGTLDASFPLGGWAF